MKKVESISLSEAERWSKKLRNKAIAKSTNKSYKKAWKRFENWASSVDLSYKPPTCRATIQLYLAYIAKKSLSSESVRSAYDGISFKHRKLGIPFEHTQMEKDLLKGARRVLRKPTRKAYAIKKEELIKMINFLLPYDFSRTRNFRDTVVNWRESAFLAMSFFLIARFADLAKLTTKNLIFTEEGILVQFGELKNNKEGAFKHGLVTKNPKGFCVVNFIKRYLKG